MLTDPIADLLTRMRNAIRNRADEVTMPYSRVRKNLAEVLQREGYVRGAKAGGEGAKRTLTVQLKYGPLGEQVIQRIQRISSPGCRFYRGVDELPRVLGGLGIVVISTSKGMLSDREARAKRLGGELVCKVW